MWIGVIMLLIVAITSALCGYYRYGTDIFGPNVQAEAFGIAVSLALTFLTIILTFEIEKKMRENTLNASRFLFLRNKAERFKEAFINYINVLGINGQLSDLYQDKSWESFSKKYWPLKHDLKKLKFNINELVIQKKRSFKAVNEAYGNLFKNYEEIVETTSTGIFEGEEDLIQKHIFPVLLSLGIFRSHLIKFRPINNSDELVDLTELSDEIKDSINNCIDILNTLVALSEKVRAPLN
jgi:hypothetical protein